MNVVLEGADNSGKTTLAKYLVTRCPTVKYFHPGGPPAGVDDEVRCIKQQTDLLRSGFPVVIDRVTPISQTIFNPDPLFNPARWAALQEMAKTDTLFVFCRPSTDRLLRLQDMTWAEHDTEEMKQKVIKNQHVHVRAYDNLMAHIRCLHYDFEAEGAAQQAEWIVAALMGSVSAKTELSILSTCLINFTKGSKS